MLILLQNRRDFYRELLPRLPDQALAARLQAIAEHCAPSDPEEWPHVRAALELEDPWKKPQLGARWGRTAISMAEVFERAIRFEELILQACAEHAASDLAVNASDRLEKLRILADDLRYHRVRLVGESS
ncbi:MAG: hypothetical protein IPK53_14990 [bacterium]|nr:hypothetical protein [bacterium]MBK8130150.1 hypothetical protein [bacterium]